MDEREVVTVSQPFFRRRVFISDLQYRLLVVNLFYFCAIVLIFAAVVFLPLMVQLRSGSMASPAEAEQVATEFLFLHARLWPALLLVLVLLALHSVIVSHRLAGPLYRFRRVLETVAEGDLSVRAKIRRNDYLTKEVAVINEMIGALAKRIACIEEQSTAMRAAVNDLMRARECGSEEMLDKTIENLGVLVDQLKTRVGQFRVAARLDETSERKT